MKKRYFLLIFCFIGIISSLFSQETRVDSVAKKEKKPKSTEYGLNMTGLILDFVPLLNRTTGRTGPYSFSYKKFRGDHAFRMGLGAHLNPNEAFNISEPLNNINIRIGHEYRKEISKRWRYSRGMDFVAVMGNFNSPIGNIGSFNNGDGGVGLGFTLGAEYLILPNLSVSTEGMLFAGFMSNSGTTINFIPPVSIFLNAKFK